MEIVRAKWEARLSYFHADTWVAFPWPGQEHGIMGRMGPRGDHLHVVLTWQVWIFEPRVPFAQTTGIKKECPHQKTKEKKTPQAFLAFIISPLLWVPSSWWLSGFSDRSFSDVLLWSLILGRTVLGLLLDQWFLKNWFKHQYSGPADLL